MIRLVRRGALPGPLIPSAPCRPIGRRRARGDVAQGSCASQAPRLQRDFSLLRQIQKQTDNRFFWPSRPDFLPSRNPRTETNAGAESVRMRRLGVIQAYRRFLPVGGAQATLPPPESITYSHAPLFTSIAKMEVDSAWTHLVSHLGDLSKGTTAPLSSALFDSLFWLVATENFSSIVRHEEVFGRVEILLLYASSQTNYGLTRLQLHRTVYIWTSLWEQYDVKQLPFTQLKFAETVTGCLNNLESRLASRVLSRMVGTCNTSDEMGEVTGRIESWLNKRECEVTRQETWTSSSRYEMVNDDAYFREEDPDVLDGQMWDTLLQQCFHIGVSKWTIRAGMLALQQAQIDPSEDSVSQFLASLHQDRLYNLLPADVRQGAAAIEDVLISPPSSAYSCSSNARDEASIGEDIKRRLVYAVAFVLATRKHYSAALYLFETDMNKDKDKDRSKQTGWSIKKAEVYTAAANACARLALYREAMQEDEAQDARWTLTQLQRSLRLFVDCNWYESRSRSTTAKILLDAILECIILDKNKAAVQSSTKWLLLLRRFTTVLLTHDPHLATLQVKEDVIAYSHLLRLHIHLRDYPFAKRLFLVRSMQESQIEACLGHGDFLWLFEQSLEKEKDARFTKQLFLYWTSLGEGESESTDVPAIPPSLLRMYFWKLKKSGQGTHAIRMLHDTLDVQNLSGKDKHHPSHATRMMRTFFSVGSDSIELSLSMAEDLLKEWKKKRKQQQSQLLTLYSIALQCTTRIEGSDALLRSSILALFASFQEHFASLSRLQRLSLVRTNRKDLLSIYSCALKVLVEEKESRPTRVAAEAWLMELRNNWHIKELDGQLWSLRIQANLVGSDADVDEARALYAQAIRMLDAKNSIEGRQQVLSPSVTSMLMMALAERGLYSDALRYVSIYQNHSGPLSPNSNAFIQGARIAILHMQGKDKEAFEELKILKRSHRKDQGAESDAQWLKIVDKATARLKDYIKIQREERKWEQRQKDNLSVVKTEEEQERARAYRAMASGQPWWRKRRRRME